MDEIAQQIGTDVLMAMGAASITPAFANMIGDAAIKSILKNMDERVPITAVERDTLVFISRFVDVSGISPSYEEIASHLGLKSKSNIHRIVHQLGERGLISLDQIRHGRGGRGIVITRLGIVTLEAAS